MKQALAFSFLALLVAVPAAAIEYRITIGDRMTGEERVRRLELAVEELQRKVFQLEGAAQAPKVNPKAYLCETTAFSKTYQAFGPTRLEAETEVKQQCIGEHGEMFCRKIECRANQ